VAEVARAHGVNANQVLAWRRGFERGELVDSCALLPVTISVSDEPTNGTLEQAAESHPSSVGSIHIELPGRAMISVESGADPKLLRSILESLSK
jgi:transposase